MGGSEGRADDCKVGAAAKGFLHWLRLGVTWRAEELHSKTPTRLTLHTMAYSRQAGLISEVRTQHNPVRTGTQTAAALDREDVWPQHSSYTHGILHGRRSSSAQCGNSCKSGSSRVLSERGGRRKILFRWRGSQEDTLRKPTSFLTWTSAR